MDSVALYLATLRWVHRRRYHLDRPALLLQFVQAWSFPKMEAAARNATQILLPRALLFF